MEQPPLLWLLGTSQICPLAVAMAMQQLALGVVRPHPCHCRRWPWQGAGKSTWRQCTLSSSEPASRTPGAWLARLVS